MNTVKSVIIFPNKLFAGSSMLQAHASTQRDGNYRQRLKVVVSRKSTHGLHRYVDCMLIKNLLLNTT